MCEIFLQAALILVALSYMVHPSPLTNDRFACNIKSSLDKPWMVRDAAAMAEQDGPVPPDPVALRLPQSQKVLASEVHKALFKPEEDSRPLPDVLKSILLPPVLPRVKPTQGPGLKTIEVLCHLDRIYVRVLKSMFTDQNAWRHLKVGTCSVNQATEKHYFFLYPLSNCNIKREENPDRVIYSNTLVYEPVVRGPIVWELPFSVPLECRYHKHHRSYQVGFRPVVEQEAVVWSLKAGVSLKSVDANWMPLVSGHSYVIGQPMYFEARIPCHEDGKRLYLNKCFVNPSPDPEITPHYTVLDNYGCMLSTGETVQMKFYATNLKTTIRFSLKAFVFKDMVSQPKKMMFIHCEMSLASEMPTATTKTCRYNLNTKRWAELYGDDSVCACCGASCSTQDRSDTVMTASDSWELEEDQVEEDQVEEDQVEEDQVEEDQVEEDQVEEDQVEEDQVEEDQVEERPELEDQVEEDQVEEDQVEEDQVEEDQVEEDQVEEDQVEEDQVEEDQVEERPVLEDQVEEDRLEEGVLEAPMSKFFPKKVDLAHRGREKVLHTVKG